MDKICSALAKQGNHVTLLGRIDFRKSGDDLKLPPDYEKKRVSLLWQKKWNGKLFYFILNLRLFIKLLFSKFDVVYGVDLDTLFPAWLAARLKGKKLIYDAHEYFPEVAEVVNRPKTKRMWERIEAFLVPKIDIGITVSQSIADIFKKKYNKKFIVLRNLPELQPLDTSIAKQEKSLVFQGKLNYGRALPELVKAMHHIDTVLTLAGNGDLEEELKQIVQQENLMDKVKFTGFIPPNEIHRFIHQFEIGINLYSGGGLNNTFSLNNKFLNYIQAGLPIVSIQYPEYERINETYEVCAFVKDTHPENIANTINELLSNKLRLNTLKENSLKARKHLIWEKEKEKLNFAL